MFYAKGHEQFILKDEISSKGYTLVFRHEKCLFI